MALELATSLELTLSIEGLRRSNIYYTILDMYPDLRSLGKNDNVKINFNKLVTRLHEQTQAYT